MAVVKQVVTSGKKISILGITVYRSGYFLREFEENKKFKTLCKKGCGRMEFIFDKWIKVNVPIPTQHIEELAKAIMNHHHTSYSISWGKGPEGHDVIFMNSIGRLGEIWFGFYCIKCRCITQRNMTLMDRMFQRRHKIFCTCKTPMLVEG